MKLIEAVMQLRPRALWRVLAHPDVSIRRAMQWYYRIGRQVWPYEMWHFFVTERRQADGPLLEEFWEVAKAPAVSTLEPLPQD